MQRRYKSRIGNLRQWVGAELSGDNNLMLYVPTGFAHGFLVLSETAEVLYKCTEEYAPEDDRGIRWNDPEIDIHWPIMNPVVSEKDEDTAFTGCG
jgi:dTDP-4-dehydrorhamnose 3,5-epimerase